MRVVACPFWLIFFVLILVQIHFVWFCSCRLCVSRGLPSEAATIHSLLSLSVLSFLSCFWCWFCVWFSYPCLCMLVVIMLIEGVIPKAEEIEELNWRSVAMDKKTNIFLLFFPQAVYVRTFQLENKIRCHLLLLSLFFGSLVVREVARSVKLPFTKL